MKANLKCPSCGQTGNYWDLQRGPINVCECDCRKKFVAKYRKGRWLVKNDRTQEWITQGGPRC